MDEKLKVLEDKELLGTASKNKEPADPANAKEGNNSDEEDDDDEVRVVCRAKPRKHCNFLTFFVCNQELAEDEQDGEMDEDNDYGNSYFDNGEGFNEEDDNMDDGPIY